MRRRRGPPAAQPRHNSPATGARQGVAAQPTERTRGFHAAYVAMEELAAEGDTIPGHAIAEDSIRYLQAINSKDLARRTPAMAAR
ncbi:MAG TPA: hypothetical protein VGH15_09240 [Caulobacteraceae bacterium]